MGFLETSIKKIKKRNGEIVEFNPEKITTAIFKAVVAVGGTDKNEAERVSNLIIKKLEERGYNGNVPSVEEVQDVVEEVLINERHLKTANAYQSYRKKRADIRKAKKMLGIYDDTKININALKVLEHRYLLKNESGNIIETPSELFMRVAKAIAKQDIKYDENADIEETKKIFYEMMKNLEFLPNSPTLMNAGTELGQLSACFVLPIGDSMEEIFDAVKNTAIIHKSGGGTGFSFSRLRPSGDFVKSTSGVSSGPLSFMKVFNVATEVIKQGGKRRGANMGILSVDHPNILDFISSKEEEGVLNNFNISVGLTKKFMDAVKKKEKYELINPRDKKVVGKLDAEDVFNLIATLAWKSGDPGIIFLDKINEENPTPELGEIESTNPCGEQPLLPYESCNLGSINLSKMVKKTGKYYEIDWRKLKETIRNAVHFLDNVIDANKYPLLEIDEMSRNNRKIGLGVMGFADLLIKLRIPYNSDKGVAIADEIMNFVTKEAEIKSRELAEDRGVFPNWEKSIYSKKGIKRRNATVTTIAPTGTLSIIAGCSSGVEPLFAISYVRKHILGGEEMLEVNPLFEQIAREKDFYSEELMERISRKGTIYDIEEIPEEVRKIFVTAHDISPEWHVMMQAIFQKHTENAVSKTVNFSKGASIADIKKVYMLAYDLDCKGITIYRDQSKSEQVLNIDRKEKDEEKPEEKIPKEIIKSHSLTEFETKEEKENDSKKDIIVVDAEYAGGCSTCHL